MMDPTCTFSSPYFFTPRYFGLESRPFLVDPVPFLCAHSMTAVRGARSATRFGAGATRVAKAESLDDSAECMTIVRDGRRRVTRVELVGGRTRGTAHDGSSGRRRGVAKGERDGSNGETRRVRCDYTNERERTRTMVTLWARRGRRRRRAWRMFWNPRRVGRRRRRRRATRGGGGRRRGCGRRRRERRRRMQP